MIKRKILLHKEHKAAFVNIANAYNIKITHYVVSSIVFSQAFSILSRKKYYSVRSDENVRVSN